MNFYQSQDWMTRHQRERHIINVVKEMIEDKGLFLHYKKIKLRDDLPGHVASSGTYNIETDEIDIIWHPEEPRITYIQSLVHEMGHRLRYFYLPNIENKLRIAYTRNKKRSKNLFVSEYSLENEEELFAEVFRYYIFSDLKHYQKKWFDTIITQGTNPHNNLWDRRPLSCHYDALMARKKYLG